MRNWILRDLCDDNLMEAVERNSLEHLFFLPARHPKMEVITKDDLVFIDTKIPSVFLNYVCTNKLTLEDIDNKINKAQEYFKEKQQPFSWVIGPSAPFNIFKEKLKKAGFVKQEVFDAMVLNLDVFKKKLQYIPGFRVQQALTKSSIQDVGKIYSVLGEKQDYIIDYFEKVSTLAFHSSDPIRFFVGYLNEKPAVVGELYLGAGVAGVRCFVHPKYLDQEKELFIDLTTKMLFQAQQQAYHFATTCSVKKYCPFFNELGFKKHYEFFRCQ